jgi:FtsZ-interacting cell division protein ZipA
VEERLLIFAGIVAIGAVAVTTLWARMERKVVPGKERTRRATGNALLGLQGFIEPSVEHVVQAQNVEQKAEEDDAGLGGDEEAIRSDLALAMSRSPVDPEEVRRHLSAAARAGMDWNALFEQATAEELTERPYRAPSLPPAYRVAPREA